MCLQLVAIYCQGMIPGLLPLVWSIVIMKVSCILLPSSTYYTSVHIQAPESPNALCCMRLWIWLMLPAPLNKVQLTFWCLNAGHAGSEHHGRADLDHHWHVCCKCWPEHGEKMVT